MIHSILTNPTYTGDLAQGRSRVKSYKVHQIEAVPREEWVEVAGTHEAIIDYETFDKVQALLQRDTRTSPKGREVHLFSGFLKCADCGRAITRCVGKNNNVYYSCSTYKNRCVPGHRRDPVGHDDALIPKLGVENVHARCHHRV